MKKKIISLVIGVIMLLFSWYLLQGIPDNKATGSLLLLFIVLLLFCIGMIFVISPFEDTKVGKILLMFFGGALSLYY